MYSTKATQYYCSGTCDMIPDLYFHYYTHTIILASQTYKLANMSFKLSASLIKSVCKFMMR